MSNTCFEGVVKNDKFYMNTDRADFIGMIGKWSVCPRLMTFINSRYLLCTIVLVVHLFKKRVVSI